MTPEHRAARLAAIDGAAQILDLTVAIAAEIRAAVEAEREACAKLADTDAARLRREADSHGYPVRQTTNNAASEIECVAAAIRARGRR